MQAQTLPLAEITAMWTGRLNIRTMVPVGHVGKMTLPQLCENYVGRVLRLMSCGEYSPSRKSGVCGQCGKGT